MVFPVIGGDGKPTGYEIDNSLRFNDGDSASLSRTPSSASNRKTWTFSTWLKRSQLSTSSMFFSVGSGTVEFSAYFVNNNDLEVYQYDSGTYRFRYITNQVFRDTSAWYHIFIACDTTQGSAGDRVKIYLNGSQITSFSTATNPSQNQDTSVNLNTPHKIGVAQYGSDFYDGYISETYLVDGSALAPTEFGETNDNGVWIPKKYDGSYGTNGFKLEYKQTGTSQNASGIGADTSGNDHHFAVTNLAATDVTVDTPTNNFCTLNFNHKSTANVLLSEGNLKAVLNQTSGWQHAAGTMAVKNGKWYWEAKALNVAATDKTSIGVVEFETDGVNFINNTNKDIINGNTAGITGHGAGVGSYSYAEGDIINVAMDMDNNKIYYGKNGTYFGNLNPASGSGSTTQTVNNSRFSVPVVGGYADSSWEMNFGVPQFSISSGNSDADGFGNFEFAVPSGFFALCTKNLAEYG